MSVWKWDVFFLKSSLTPCPTLKALPDKQSLSGFRTKLEKWMENLENARVTSRNLGSRSHACPKLPLFSGCEVWPLSVMSSMNKMLIRKFQSQLSVKTFTLFPNKKRFSCVAKSIESTTNWGRGTEIPSDGCENSPNFFSSNENPCVVFNGYEKEHTNCSRNSDNGFLYLLIFHPPVSCDYNMVLSPLSLVSRLLDFLWLFIE